MMYSFNRLSAKRFKSAHKSPLKVLLPLCFCALLLGCDSHSSSPTIDKNTIPVNTDNAYNDDFQTSNSKSDSAELEQNNEEGDLVASSVDESAGESLISAAKSDRKSASSRSSVDVEPTKKSKMQATLIGDYTGIMPCASCDSTQVLLNLFADGSVKKTSIYDNPQTPRASLTENGIYRQDNDTITIVYDDQHIESYLIQSNHLVLLDDNKVADSDYTLSRR